MSQHLALVALLVNDYDEAIAWFTTVLGFTLLEDTRLSETKRWVTVAPRGDGKAGLLLARAANDDQRAVIGRQGGGRVFLFLHTDDLDRDYAAWRGRGVRFVEEPRRESYGKVVVFEDLYGNKWDLIERRDGSHQARAIAASWEANAAAWTDAVRQGAIASRRAGTDAAIVSAVRQAGGRRVLDLGCGEGWLARALAPHGFDVTGIDGSDELIERAREAGQGRFEVLGYEALVGEPSAAAGPFDIAVLNFALLADTIGPLLRAIRDRLVPGGTLIIQTLHPTEVTRDQPYADGWRVETFGTMAGFAHPMPWYFRTLGSWAAEVRQPGFVIERIDEPVDPGTGRPLSLLLIASR